MPTEYSQQLRLCPSLSWMQESTRINFERSEQAMKEIMAA
jgi:hypothetical protein